MIPPATYRVQFTPDFRFRDALGIVEYLSALGGFWLYASPVFAARPGSTHGYDVLNPNRFNPELGTEADFNELVARLQDQHMGWLQDAVPNHMAYSGANPMLADLFALGDKSAFAPYFDIWWNHPAEGLSGRVAAPLLGDELDRCLERGEIRPVLQNGILGVVYFEHFFPLRLSHYALLEPASQDAEMGWPPQLRDMWARSVRDIVENAQAPPSSDRDARVGEARDRIIRLMKQHPEVRRLVEARLKGLDPQDGNPEAVAALKGLLLEQVYALRHWRSAGEEINYRRFFDINELICLRQERPQVFDHTHRLLIRLILENKINGLRIDHIDGLCDPARYLHRLRKACGDIYLVVEKILAEDEALPPLWPVEGTSGYEFCERVTRLFCRRDAKEPLSALYEDFSGRHESFAEICRSAKKQVLEESFAGDLANLVQSVRMAAAEQAGQDQGVNEKALRDATVELLMRFPVYRTYADPTGLSDADERLIGRILQEASHQRPDLVPALDVVGSCFFGEPGGHDEGGPSAIRFRAVSRFQKLCAPLAAKGIEDTALYRHVRLISLNEVGGDPDEMGISPSSFHAFLTERKRLWPHTLNALSTHDSKRSEDVRARINVLSEIPDEWRLHCTAWRELNRNKKPVYHGTSVPDPNVEYLLYQTLVGTFPFDPSTLKEYGPRIQDYMVKAVRESKMHTSWRSPDAGYEQALGRFVRRLLFPDAKDTAFMRDFIPFVNKVARLGVYNSLAQTLIKITAPGVPDFYQGTELFDFSLVDPDNRRPVDFQYRSRLLKAIQDEPGKPPSLPQGHTRKEGYDRMKLYLIASALGLRKQRPALFQEGSYEPLEIAGRFCDHALSYARVEGKQYCLTVIPRFLNPVVPEGQAPLGDRWADTVLHLPDTYPTRWTSVLSQERYAAEHAVPLKTVLGRFPVALLMGEVH